MPNYTIAGIGELLWDVLGTTETLGGAPINFTFHAAELQANALAISTVGDDNRGHTALKILNNFKINIDGVSISGVHPTGYVNAEVNEQGIASYHFPDDVAWDHLQVNDLAWSCKDKLDAICFGTLAQRSANSRAAIHNYLNSTSEQTLKVYDLNLRQNFYSTDIILSSLNICDVFKLNDEELAVLSDMLELHGSDHEKLAALCLHFNLNLAILTKGENGSVLLSNTAKSVHPGINTHVVDTIGAGDSFTAAVVMGLLLEKPLELIHHKAAEIASYVCSKPGAMVTIPSQYRFNE